MAPRRPLVVINGNTQEIPDTDSIQYVDNRIAVAAAQGNAVAGVETLSRFGLDSSMPGVSGQLKLAFFVSARDITLSKLTVVSGNTAGSGITLARLALFIENADLSLTKVAQTASDTAMGAGSYSTYERAMSTVGGFPASYAVLGGVRYAIGWLQVATSPCTLYGMYMAGADTPPIPFRNAGGQSDIAASYTAAAAPSDYRMIYLRGAA
jgi:hypothetical protein